MESVSLYSEARNEYLKQMATWVVPPLVEFFRKEFQGIALREGRKAMTVFQSWCSEVPRWNQDVIETNVNSLLDSCRCDYVEELMTAVFIAHTKMLTAIRVNTRQKKLQITLPKLDHFLHRVFVECARAFWKAPFLFIDTVSPIDMQKNVLQAESMCTEALSGAVRSLLPVKSILRDNLEEEEASSSEDDEPIERKKKSGTSFKKAGGGVPVPKEPVAPQLEEDSDEDEVVVSEEDEVVVEEAKPTVVEPTVVEEAKPTVIEEVKSVVEEAKSAVVEDIKPAIVEDVKSNVIEEVTPAVEEVKPAPSSEKIVQTNSSPNHVNLVKEEPNFEHASTDTITSPQEFVIDTEPSVHFTPYDTVYDENTPNVSEIRYAPKISIEDKPPSSWYDDDEYDGRPLPKIRIQEESTGSLNDLDIEDLNPRSTPSAQNYDTEEDQPLDLMGDDFETLG